MFHAGLGLVQERERSEAALCPVRAGLTLEFGIFHGHLNCPRACAVSTSEDLTRLDTRQALA